MRRDPDGARRAGESIHAKVVELLEDAYEALHAAHAWAGVDVRFKTDDLETLERMLVTLRGIRRRVGDRDGLVFDDPDTGMFRPTTERPVIRIADDLDEATS